MMMTPRAKNNLGTPGKRQSSQRNRMNAAIPFKPRNYTAEKKKLFSKLTA